MINEINNKIKELNGNTDNISDGYHTFGELYEYRKIYNAAFFNMLHEHGVCKVHKSLRHSSGELCFGGGWFIVMADLPTGQVSNHYEIKDWGLFNCPAQDLSDEWDGHTPQEAAERIKKFCDPDSKQIALRLLFIDAKGKEIIYYKNKVYQYNGIILGATDDLVMIYFNSSNNAPIVEAIKKETYPSCYE